MKFLQSKREINEKSYFPGPGYYYSSPNNPKFNDFYKVSFFQNTANTDNNVLNFGTVFFPFFTYSYFPLYFNTNFSNFLVKRLKDSYILHIKPQVLVSILKENLIK